MEDIKKTREMPTVTNDVDFNRNKWFFSLGGIGRDMAYSLVASYFFMYVQFGLTLTVAQFATLSILIGVFNLLYMNVPINGVLISNCLSSHSLLGIDSNFDKEIGLIIR